MTIMQEDIYRYLYERFGDVTYHMKGTSVVQMIDSDGTKTDFTCNLYGDIMDSKTKRIIAVSDLPHDMDLVQNQRPTKWETV